MKNRIFMYLFVFSLLLVVFQYVSSKNIIKSYDVKLTKALEDKNIYKDSLQIMADKQTDIYSFNFDTNDDAMTYIEDSGYKISEFIPYIKDELFNLNIYESEDHPLVPYASMTKNRMTIDNVKLLNHKWIIASFTDGSYWGEMLLSYEIYEGKLNFKVIASTLYNN